jgi:N-acetylmuramoyl-L-alanine amidase
LRSLARALVVIVAVTLAGTALVQPTAHSTAAPSADSSSPEEATLDGARLTAPTATETSVRQALARKAAQDAARDAAGQVARQAARAKQARKPLRSITIALDPGHQLGNHNYPRRINAPVPAGGFTKPCNTTGTATNAGVAEATVNIQLARAVTRRLRALGAHVRLTRVSNRQHLWGPCVDTRGRFGKRVGAKLMVSLHADGAPSSAHGFHVIAPKSRTPWTNRIAAPSLRLAKHLRAGLTHYGVPRARYVADGTGLDVRGDLGTLNKSGVPVAMIEVGNMRNATDARRMTSRSGRAQYAAAVVRGIRAYLHR